MDGNGRRTVAVVDHVLGHRDALCSAVLHSRDLHLVVAEATVDDISPDVLARLGGLLLQVTEPGPDPRQAVVRARVANADATIVVVLPWADTGVAGALAERGADCVIPTDAPLRIALAALGTGSPDQACGHAGLAGDRARAAAARMLVTERELEVLRRLSEGAPPQLIAHDLGRSVDTVRHHLRALRDKLGCATAVELVVTAYRHGMLPGLGRPLV